VTTILFLIILYNQKTILILPAPPCIHRRYLAIALASLPILDSLPSSKRRTGERNGTSDVKVPHGTFRFGPNECIRLVVSGAQRSVDLERDFHFVPFSIHSSSRASGRSEVSPFNSLPLAPLRRKLLTSEAWTRSKRLFGSRCVHFLSSMRSLDVILANKTMVSDTQPDERILFILSHVEGTTNRIGRILNKHNVWTIFKSPKKIGQILRNPKDQRSPLSSAGIYKIPCSYGQVYIEETGRIVNLRIKEHQRDVRLKHTTRSALLKHNIKTGYQIFFDKTTVVNITLYLPRKYKRNQRYKNILTSK